MEQDIAYLEFLSYFDSIISDCGKAIIFDGHSKGARLVCECGEGEIIECEEIKPIDIGCFRTPVRGSYFCNEHVGNQVTKVGWNIPRS